RAPTTRARARPPARAWRCRGRAARPSWPRPASARRPAARRSPPPDGTPAPHEARLLFAGAAATTGLCGRGTSRCLLCARAEQQPHGAGERFPFRLFGGQLRAPLRRDAIVAGAFALVGQLPRRRDPASGLEPVERRVQRTGLDLEQVFGRSL